MLNIENKKICNNCNIEKDISNFEWQKNRPNPRKICKNCRQKNRVFTEEQIERKKQYKIEYWKSGIGKEKYEKWKYGISKKEFKYECCSICSSKDRLSIDHCHKNGKFRGLLCNNCNTAIGLMKENIKIFEIAIEYLKHFKNNGEAFIEKPLFEILKNVNL